MKNKRKNDMKTITVFLFIVTLLVWLTLVFVKIIFWKLSPASLLDDIIANILGILPPVLIFNFAYEYLTKQHMADEMGEQITKTLLGNPEALEAFSAEDKIRFVKSTINSLTDENCSEMVNAVVEPYITDKYNIRSSYKYTVILRNYQKSKIFAEDKYLKIYENFKFTKKYVSDEKLLDSFSIAFIMKNCELDVALRSQKYIFQENLNISESELKTLISLTEDERNAFIKEEMKMKVFVDEAETTISGVEINNNAIVVSFESAHDKENDSHNIEICFAMPQLKGHSEFFVSINEPTYSPMIQLSYPEDIMNVKVFPFLNDGNKNAVEHATRGIGNYEFCVQNKWIYPISGVLFTIEA